jgi:hypothetical protein
MQVNNIFKNIILVITEILARKPRKGGSPPIDKIFIEKAIFWVYLSLILFIDLIFLSLIFEIKMKNAAIINV